MAIFEIINLYKVDPLDRSLQPSSYNTEDISPAQDLEVLDFQDPFYCHGLGKLDLAMFAAVMDDTGVSSFDGLVVDSDKSRSLVVPSDLLDTRPDLITPELARKIATLDADEVAQLGLSRAIQSAIATRYPGIKSY